MFIDFAEKYVFRARVKRGNMPCNNCQACFTDDCGICKFCLDKRTFGGPGKLKKRCELRVCKISGRGRRKSRTSDYSQTTLSSCSAWWEQHTLDAAIEQHAFSGGVMNESKKMKIALTVLRITKWPMETLVLGLAMLGKGAGESRISNIALLESALKSEGFEKANEVIQEMEIHMEKVEESRAPSISLPAINIALTLMGEVTTDRSMEPPARAERRLENSLKNAPHRRKEISEIIARYANAMQDGGERERILAVTKRQEGAEMEKMIHGDKPAEKTPGVIGNLGYAIAAWKKGHNGDGVGGRLPIYENQKSHFTHDISCGCCQCNREFHQGKWSHIGEGLRTYEEPDCLWSDCPFFHHKPPFASILSGQLW